MNYEDSAPYCRRCSSTISDCICRSIDTFESLIDNLEMSGVTHIGIAELREELERIRNDGR